ncbi:hypothetical protein ADUPG1_005758, partial [Aduncisulcus paluster]
MQSLKGCNSQLDPSSCRVNCRAKSVIVGIDLDNTIIRYDNSLHRIAVER